MRTTLTIDDLLLRRLRQKAAASGQSFKQVVNDTLRAGLDTSPPVRREPYRCPTFSIGAVAAGFDLSKANRLAGEVEDQSRLEKLRQGR
ncbi:MAG: hypothetical protein VKI81_08665 [Synechococcaceae cyanobacterium]|nr:hypothetical protein [Synechococcaceae cyanobacterium]